MGQPSTAWLRPCSPCSRRSVARPPGRTRAPALAPRRPLHLQAATARARAPCGREPPPPPPPPRGRGRLCAALRGARARLGGLGPAARALAPRLAVCGLGLAWGVVERRAT